MVFSGASVVSVAFFCKLYGCRSGLAYNSFFMSSKVFCCFLPNEKLLFLMLIRSSIFVAKSGIILPSKIASPTNNSNCFLLVGAFAFFFIFSTFRFFRITRKNLIYAKIYGEDLE